MTKEAEMLDRPSVEAALADYLLQANFGGYAPVPHKVIAIRRADRTAWLRNAVTPVRWEVYYFIEGELLPEAGTTRLPEGVSAADYARKLVSDIWETLRFWNAYDFTNTSLGLDYQKYIPPASTWRKAAVPGTDREEEDPRRVRV
jgi:hypothetical protein